MKCLKCDKEGEYRFDMNWFCWTHYLEAQNPLNNSELKLSKNERGNLKK
jgi:hypothetical protein